MLPITEKIIPYSNANRPGGKNSMRYITIHNTGNGSKGAGALSHANFLCNGGGTAAASFHYAVDEKAIYRCLPDNESAYHCGDGMGVNSGNNNSIGIEICMNSDGDLLKATNNAAELTAYLCKLYDIPLSNVVQHNKWSGKNCPQMIRQSKPYDWNIFIGKVQSFMSDEPKTNEPSDWAKDSWDKAKKQGIFDGTNPQSPMTREQAAVILDRLGLLKGV